MDLIVAMVLASMEADRAVAKAIQDSSCVECRKLEESISTSLNGCRTCSQVSQSASTPRAGIFRGRMKGGSCGH